MIPKDILKQIHRIKITTSHMVTDALAGQYHSMFKGKGMEFDEVREYFPGDDIRSIDWNVTARTGHPHVKKFVEERELTVMILLDMSASLRFASKNKLKSQLAAEISSLLAFTAIKNNDKVGLIGFTDEVEIFVPPRKGTRHIMRIVREALYYKPKGIKTNISQAIEYLSKITNRKTVTFIISDFYEDDFKRPLAVANKRHDIVAVAINDPKEHELPSLGVMQFRDRETGKKVVVDTSDSDFRKKYKARSIEKFEKRKKLFQSINVDFVELSTDRSYSNDLFAFFRKRARKVR